MDKRIVFTQINKKGLLDISVCNSPLTLSELKKLEEFSSKLIYLLSPLYISHKMVCNNHKDLNSFIYEQESASSDLNALDSYEKPYDCLITLNQRILNLLTSMSLFLVKSENLLKEVYGKKSQELTQWNKERNLMHSESVAYQFSYMLRNYAQHKALPLDNISVDYCRGGDKQVININLHKDTMLTSGYKWTKAELLTLSKLPNTINLIPILNEYIKISIKLFAHICKIAESELNAFDFFIKDLLEKYNVPTGSRVKLALNFESVENLNFEEIPIMLKDKISKHLFFLGNND